MIRCDVARLQVRQRREVAVAEGEPVVVVADVEHVAQPLGQPSTKQNSQRLAQRRIRGGSERHAERLALRALDLELDLLAVGLAHVHMNSSSAVRNSQSRKSSSSRPLTEMSSVPARRPSSSAIESGCTAVTLIMQSSRQPVA